MRVSVDITGLSPKDGRGGADPSAGSGILGLRDRAEAVGGTLFVISPPGKGTVVTAQIPLNEG
jgi:signal transduction histidine kinase